MFFNLFKRKKKFPLKQLTNPTYCKCCNTISNYIGQVSFHKNCESKTDLETIKTPSLVDYHLCPNCGFLFTSSFDNFSDSDWESYIYNNDYILFDPDYLSSRPLAFSNLIKTMFDTINEKPIMLDFGGGSGVLADTLHKSNIEMDTYDPYSKKFKEKPSKKYPIIFSFEVVEHSPTPIETFKEIFDLLDENGVIVFSTLLHPKASNEELLNWWYLAPRNGHISLHSEKSLAHSIAFKSDYVIAPFGHGLHIAFNPNNIPNFAKLWFH